LAKRIDNREYDQMRPVRITRNYTANPNGSVLVEFGETKVLCTAMVEDGVPPFLLNSGKGWVTAEYAMLPGSSSPRKQRESRRGKPDSRSLEIGRLVGRALRAVTDLKKLGNRTFWIDCDVLQADGGTRTAAVTGGYVALHDAMTDMKRRKSLSKWPLRDSVAAVSVGIVKGALNLDLNYHEDSRAGADMNIMMTGGGDFVEIQGAAEKGTFNDQELAGILDLARKGIQELTEIQNRALGTAADDA
jgi:ribonuclease PH